MKAMKKTMKLFSAVAAFVLAFALVCLAGCNGSVQNENVSVTSVTLTAENNATTLKVGETLQLTATVSPKNATNQAVTFSSSSAETATVSETGLVTGSKAGKVTIKVTTADGGKTASLDLTVEAAQVRVTSVTLSAENDATSLKVGETLQLTATVSPENATNQAVTFSSSSAETATVSETGLVTGVKAGEVTITATTSDGGFTATLGLTVAEAQSAAATYLFKGVDAARTGGSMGEINENEKTADGDTALGNINLNMNATLTFVVNAEKEGKAGLYLNLAFGSESVDNIFDVHVNGTAVSVPDMFTATQGANWVTYEDYFFANIDLKAGNNTIVLTVKGACGNFYAMKLIADQKLTAGEAEGPITGTAYVFKGVDAARTGGSLGDINENETAPDGGKALGNINANIGATLTFKVNASEAGRAGLYLDLQLGSLAVEDIFELRVNGELVVIPHIVNVINPDGWAPWATYEEYFLANIDLKAGENTIVLTVTGHCGNFNYMKLISESDLTAAE